MRIAFAGTPEFACSALTALHAAGHEVALVLTQPDRPGGRGMKLQPSAVKQFALDQGLPLAQPRSLRLDGKYPDDATAARRALMDANVEVLVVAAYGLILPQWVLHLPRFGGLNIHGSLLPRWRGAAPIHRAIEAGDTQTGITLMQMDAGLDTGDMLAMQAVPILATDTTGSLHDKLAALGASMVVEALGKLEQGADLEPVRQPEAGVTYAHKLEKHEALIDWTESAELIARRIRAFNPFPGASTTMHGETVKLWGATAVPATAPVCGTVLCADADGIVVSACDGAVSISQLQRPGGKRLSAADFLRGFALPKGTVLGPA